MLWGLSFIALGGLASLHPAVVDSWGAPRLEHASANGQFVLKVGGGLKNSKRMRLLRTWEAGTEELWSRGYVDERKPPHRAYVADDGWHVVLRDQHSNLGGDPCLVFLGPEGKVLRAYAIEDFLTQHEILNTKRTISSLWWSEPGWFALRDGDRQFALATSSGTLRCFETATGASLTVAGELRMQLLAEARHYAAQLLADPDPLSCVNGAKLLGRLGSVESAGLLRAHLGDRRVTSYSKSSTWNRLVSGVQLAAAESLVRLIGSQALPWIEEAFASASEDTRTIFWETLSRTGLKRGLQVGDFPGLEQSPIPREIWERWATSESWGIRKSAQAYLLANTDGAYLRMHPELLKSSDHAIRHAALVALSEHGTADDLPVLRTLFKGTDTSGSLWALRGLIRLNPPGLEALLVETLELEEGMRRFTALMELARRGRTSALREVGKRIELLGAHDHEAAGWFTSHREAERLCQFVAEENMNSARGALLTALGNPCEDLQRATCGALASLGDERALGRLRGFAREGSALERASTIRWLGRVCDFDSEEFLARLLDHEEPWIREAAKEALDQLR